MAETTADVRRDIELTRERMTDTLTQLEHKLNLMQVVREHPWPALGLAFGAGILLSGSGSDVKAAAAATAATQGASTRVGSLLDDMVANLMTGVTAALTARADELVNELKSAIGAPATTSHTGSAATSGTATAGGSMRTSATTDTMPMAGASASGAPATGYNTGTTAYGSPAESLGSESADRAMPPRAD